MQKKGHKILSLFLWICLLLLNVFLVGFGFNITESMSLNENFEIFEDCSSFIHIYGENFQKCDLIVDVTFDDLGSIFLKFKLPPDELLSQKAWIMIENKTGDSYEIEVTGNVKERIIYSFDDQGFHYSSYNEVPEGAKKFLEFCKLEVDSVNEPETIHVKLHPESVISQYSNVLKIRVPYIVSEFTNSSKVKDDLKYMATVSPEDIDYDRLQDSMVFAEIGENKLTSAVIDINATYESKKYFYDSNYSLDKVFPFTFDRSLQAIEWETQYRQFIPIIEYKIENVGKMYSIISFLLICVGSFLLPITFKKLIFAVISDNKQSDCSNDANDKKQNNIKQNNPQKLISDVKNKNKNNKKNKKNNKNKNTQRQKKRRYHK